MSTPDVGRRVTTTLTDAQVAQVVRDAAGGTLQTGSLFELGSMDELRRAMLPLLGNQAYSQPTLRAAIVLAAFPVDGSERELTDVARSVGLSPGTTHRIARSWIALGLLEQNADTRRYRRPPARRPGGTQATSVGIER